MFILKLVGLYLISAFFLFQIQISSPHLADNDPYYHIKLASIISESGPIKEMPWARFSLWSEYPYDKDLLFHLALVPFLNGESVGELTWSAKLASAFFGALLPASLYLVLHLCKVRYALLFTGLLIVAPLSFTVRVTLLRPYLFSIVFCLLGMLSIIKRSNFALLILTILYTLSYNTSLLLPLFALIFIASQLSNSEKPNWAALYSSLAGVVIGALLHPNSSSLIPNLYYQNILVLFNHWGSNPNMLPPIEMRPFAFEDFIKGYYLFLTTTLLITYYQYKSIRFRPSIHLSVQFISIIFLILSLLSQRFVEYWIPFSIWSIALSLAHLFEIQPALVKLFSNSINKLGLTLASTAILFVFANSTYRSLTDFYFHIRRPLGQEAATWMSQNIKSGETIFTCDWDDTPQLFLQNDMLNFLVCADPSYMYSWRRDLWDDWRRVVSGTSPDYDTVINRIFGAKYVYCTRKFNAFWEQLSQDSNYTEVYKDDTAKIYMRKELE